MIFCRTSSIGGYSDIILILIVDIESSLAVLHSFVGCCYILYWLLLILDVYSFLFGCLLILCWLLCIHASAEVLKVQLKTAEFRPVYSKTTLLSLSLLNVTEGLF